MEFRKEKFLYYCNSWHPIYINDWLNLPRYLFLFDAMRWANCSVASKYTLQIFTTNFTLHLYALMLSNLSTRYVHCKYICSISYIYMLLTLLTLKLNFLEADYSNIFLAIKFQIIHKYNSKEVSFQGTTIFCILPMTLVSAAPVNCRQARL